MRSCSRTGILQSTRLSIELFMRRLASSVGIACAIAGGIVAALALAQARGQGQGPSAAIESRAVESQAVESQADLVVVHAKVLTLDAQSRVAEGLAIREGR